MPNSVSIMSNSFHIVVNLSNIMKTWYLHHLQKSCVLKAIWYENRAKLFLLNGNKRPIRYESHNGVKPSPYNLNNPYKGWYLWWQIAVTVLRNLVIIVSSLSTRCFIKLHSQPDANVIIECPQSEARSNIGQERKISFLEY